MARTFRCGEPRRWFSRAATLRSTAKLFPMATAFPALRLQDPALAEEMALVLAEASGQEAWARAEQVMAAREERAARSAARLRAKAARTITISKTACRTAAAEARLGRVRGPERVEEMAEEPLRYKLPTLS